MEKQIATLQFITQASETRSHTEQAKLAIAGGCNWVQLRMKDCTDAELLETAKAMKTLCSEKGVLFIVNDNPELAKEVQADGVHLGKNDMSPKQARALLGNNVIIGGTANTIEDIQHLYEQGVDYIGCGPFRFTKTKKNLSPIVGAEGYKCITQAMNKRGINLPIVGIGGITLNDLTTLKNTGLTGIAVSGLIANAPEATEKTKEIIAAWQQ